MVKKIIPFNVAIKSTAPVRSFDRPKVYTNDLNSVEIQFKVTDCTTEELETATATTQLFMRDESFFQNPTTDVTRVGNVFSYTLKENEGNHDGLAQIQLVMIIGGTELASPLLEFEIISGLETKVAQEVMIYDWTTLTRDARAFLDAAELAETDRVTAEGNRVTAENNRTTAESGRVTAESGRVTAESGRVTTFAGYNARITGMEADVNVSATNIIDNGDFSNSGSGWALGGTSPAVLNVTDSKIGSNCIELNSTDGSSVVIRDIAVASGNKLYVGMWVKLISFVDAYGVDSAFSLYDYNTYNNPTESKLNKGIVNEWQHVSTVKNAAGGGIKVVGGYVGSTTRNARVDGVIAIDLTATFGAGNEPTVEQMDRLLTQFPNSWFDGTENLFLAKWALNELRRLDNEKANKDQEAWITPTLLNGWGEYSDRKIQYRKDEFGIVRLSGLLRDGVIDTVAFILPAGYRPNSVIQYFYGGTGNGLIISGSDGHFTVTNGANNPVAIDGITFPTF